MDIQIVQIRRRPQPILDDEVLLGTAPPSIVEEGESWLSAAPPAWQLQTQVVVSTDEYVPPPSGSIVEEGDSFIPPRPSLFWPVAPPPVVNEEFLYGTTSIGEGEGSLLAIVVNHRRRHYTPTGEEELSFSGTSVSVALFPTELGWLAPPVTATSTAGINLAVTELGWIVPPVIVSTGTDVSLSLAPVEMAWLAPPVSASGSTGVSANAYPTELGWIAPPVSVSVSLNVSPLAPKALAWLAPPVSTSAGGSALVNLAPVELAWLAPPVAVSAGVTIAANVASLAFNQVGAQACGVLFQFYALPCGLALAKVSAGFVGQIPTPDIVFTDLERKPIYT